MSEPTPCSMPGCTEPGIKYVTDDEMLCATHDAQYEEYLMECADYQDDGANVTAHESFVDDLEREPGHLVVKPFEECDCPADNPSCDMHEQPARDPDGYDPRYDDPDVWRMRDAYNGLSPRPTY